MTDDLLEKLERLAKLKEQGVLTDAEFEQQKSALLGTKSEATSPPQQSSAPVAPLVAPPSKSIPVKTQSAQGGLPKWAKWTVGIFAFLMAGSLINKCNENQTSVTSTSTTDTVMSTDSIAATATTETPVAPVENWSYYSDTDKMGSKYQTASVDATELLQFDFPYNGGSTATLTIRKKGGSTDLYLRVSKGQFIMSASDGGKARIRFDGGSPATYSTSGAADYSSDIVFFDSAKSLIAKIKRSKKMIVEVEFYQEGNRQIEFNVDGLKWPK